MDSPTKSSNEWDDYEFYQNEAEHEIWTEVFRQGNATVRFCGTCGRPQHKRYRLSLGVWIMAPLMCGQCLREIPTSFLRG